MSALHVKISFSLYFDYRFPSLHLPSPFGWLTASTRSATTTATTRIKIVNVATSLGLAISSMRCCDGQTSLRDDTGLETGRGWRGKEEGRRGSATQTAGKDIDEVTENGRHEMQMKQRQTLTLALALPFLLSPSLTLSLPLSLPLSFFLSLPLPLSVCPPLC